MTRLYPLFVSFLGSFGIATALAYCGAVVLSFSPKWTKLSSFMVGDADGLQFGFVLVLVPYALLLAHLYLRPRVGAWLLDRDANEAAFRYANRRCEKSLLRSGREATAHRLVCIQCHIRNLDYDASLPLLDFEVPRKRNPFLSDWARWGLELHLRRENLLDAAEWVARFETLKSEDDAFFDFIGARMELAIRNRDEESYRALVEQLPPGKRPERAELSRALAFDFEQISDATRFETLAGIHDSQSQLVPGRTAGLLAIRAGLALAIDGESTRAVGLMKLGQSAPADSRSEFELARVRDRTNGQG